MAEEAKTKRRTPSSGGKSKDASRRPRRNVSQRGARRGLARPRKRTGEGDSRGRARSEFDQKVVDVRRVTRVVAGGRRFSFSVVVIAGDRKGRVGVGVGKGTDTAVAIEKAARQAKKNLVAVPLTDTGSIRHEVSAKYKTVTVRIIPAAGKGLVAGSAVRTVLDLAGVTDISSKVLSRSKNKLNIAMATIKALRQLS